MPRPWEHVREIHVGEQHPDSAAWIDDQTTAAWTPEHVRFVFWPPRDQAERASTDHLQAALADVVAAAEARARRTPTGPRRVVHSSTIRPRAPRLRPPRAVVFGVAAVCAGVLAVVTSRALLAWLWSPMQASGPNSMFHDLSRSGVAAAQAPATQPPARASAAAPAAFVPPPSAARAPAPKPSAVTPPRRIQRPRVHASSPPPSAASASAEAISEDATEPADASGVTDVNFMDAPISAREARAIAEGRAHMGTAALNQPTPVSMSAPLGTLRINSRPWALLFIDGKYVGNTPQLRLRLRPGEHSVRLVNTEFGMSRVFTVELGAGETLTRVEELGDDSPPLARSSTFQGKSETRPELPLQLMP